MKQNGREPHFISCKDNQQKKGMALRTHSEIQFGLRDAPDTLAATEFVRFQCNIDLKEQVTE